MREIFIKDNIRQSKQWSQYFYKVGWKDYWTSSGKFFAIRSVGPLKIAKMQRPSNLTTQDLHEIFDVCKKDGVVLLKLEPNIDQDLTLLEDFVLSKTPLSPSATIVTDLTKPLEEIKSIFTHSANYSINRATREGFYTKAIQNPNDIELLKYYKEIVKPTAKLQKFYLPPFSFSQAFRDAFKEASYLFYVYDKDNNPIAAKFFVCNKTMCLYATGGTTAAGRKSKGGYLLVLEIIKYLKNAGYQFIDWEGIEDHRFPHFAKKWKGFSDFKYKFGGERILYPVPYVKYFNPIMEFCGKKLGLDF